MNISFFLLVTFFCCSGFCTSFNQTKDAINDLPRLRESAIAENIEKFTSKPENIYDAVPLAHLPGLNFDEFYKVEQQFFRVLENSSLSNKKHWLNAPIDCWQGEIPILPTDPLPSAPQNGYFDATVITPRQHYVQKLIVPEYSKILLHGDLHGDVHSVLESLAPYMKGDKGFELNHDTYVMFLGDYTDKGLYGLECMYILMRLKIDNPDRVFFVRGNHEDSVITRSEEHTSELQSRL